MFDEAAFWKLVGPPDPITGCRIWQDRKFNGYGRCSRPYRFAHRAAWILTHGPIPIVNGRSLNINHKINCNTRACCELTHLYLGTQYQNMIDLEITMSPEERQRRVEARRQGQIRGEACYNTFLTEKDVLAIRKSTSLSTAQIARDYNVSWGVVKNIRDRKSWKHVE